MASHSLSNLNLVAMMIALAGALPYIAVVRV